MTDSGTTMSDEFGRIGNTNPIVTSSGATQTEFPEHRVRDLRTSSTNTELPDLDTDTLNLVFAHSGKFQSFVDQMKHGNRTLQEQLQSQENHLGNMTSATMHTFREILKSIGFEEKSIPKTVSPDDMMCLLDKVQSVSPVALSEISAMRNLIDSMKAQRTTEVVDVGSQYEVQDQPRSATVRPRMYPSPIDTGVQWRNRRDSTPTPVTSMFAESSPSNRSSKRGSPTSAVSDGPIRYPSAFSSPSSNGSSPIHYPHISPDIPIQPQFIPNPTPSPQVNIPQSRGGPSVDQIFGSDTAVGASEDTNAANTRAPEVLSYDAGFKQTSSRKTRK
ncbi:hypothetical protein HDU88_008748 [Geranomyces variabilis]|nr:hypothetical protein HDU88_008748 [Geranomyces variabilis]